MPMARDASCSATGVAHSVIHLWDLDDGTGQPGTSGPQFMMDFMTDVHGKLLKNTTPFTDDPAYRCGPWRSGAAGLHPEPEAIRQQGEDIIFSMNDGLERVVHMNQDAAPAGTPETSSLLTWSLEGDTLIVSLTISRLAC